MRAIRKIGLASCNRQVRLYSTTDGMGGIEEDMVREQKIVDLKVARNTSVPKSIRDVADSHLKDNEAATDTTALRGKATEQGTKRFFEQAGMDITAPWVKKFPRMPYHISTVTQTVKRMSSRIEHQVASLRASLTSAINVYDVHSTDLENLGCFEEFLHLEAPSRTTRSGNVLIARLGWKVYGDNESTNCIAPDFSKLITSQDLSTFGPEISKPASINTTRLNLISRRSEMGDTTDPEATGDMLTRRFSEQLPGSTPINFTKLSSRALFKLTGLVRTNDKLGHYYSLSPDILNSDIDNLISRGLTHVDIIILDSIHVVKTLLTDEYDFESYLTDAFSTLEEHVKKGNISYYGVDTHKCFGGSKTKDFVDLRLVQRAAERAGGKDNHLRLVSMPFNLTERGALLEPMADDYKESVFSFLRDNELGCLTTRPLSTYNKDGNEERYVDHQKTTDLELFSKTFPKQLTSALMLEERGEKLLHNTVMRPAPELYQIGQAILQCQDYINNFYLFDTFIEQRYDETFRLCMNQLEDSSDELITSWITTYSTAYEHIKRTYRRYLQHVHAQRDDKIKSAISVSLGDVVLGDTLSQIALNAVVATGVMQTVAVGMRTNYYQRDLISTNYRLISKVPMSVVGRLFTDPEVSFITRTPDKKFSVNKDTVSTYNEDELRKKAETGMKDGVYGEVYVVCILLNVIK